MKYSRTDKPKEDIHKDLLGKDITVGSHVAAPHYNTMVLGRVLALTPKMVKISKLNESYKNEIKKYAWECVLLEPDDITYYILRNSD